MHAAVPVGSTQPALLKLVKITDPHHEYAAVHPRLLIELIHDTILRGVPFFHKNSGSTLVMRVCGEEINYQLKN
jgi:hypothetical protein